MSATKKQSRETLPEGKKFNEKVIIVGAGYAGISAARELLNYTDEKNVTVLEAQSRVGGRVRSQKWEYPHHPEKSFHIELGAQWIGPGQKEINEWCKNEKLAETRQEGNPLFWFGNEIHHDENTGKFVEHIVGRIVKMIKTGDNKTTWIERIADSINVDRLLRPAEGSNLQAIAKRAIEISFAMKADKMSVLSALTDIKSAGGLSEIMDVEGGAQESFLPAGFQNLLEKIAAPFRNRICFDEPVISIDQSGDPDNVIVTTTKQQHKAKRVIVTIPPILLVPRASDPKIEPVVKFIPELSPERRALIGRLTLGSPIKCFAIFSRPFWRDINFSGQTLSDRFPFAASYDCSPYEDGPGVLTIFIKEREKGEFMLLDQESKKRKILLEICAYLCAAAAEEELLNLAEKGLPDLVESEFLDFVESEFLDLIVHAWDENSEPWAAGGYSCSYPPGVLSQYGELLKNPWGRIHWAGTETADKWRGFMEGAILSGRRAAHEVMDSF